MSKSIRKTASRFVLLTIAFALAAGVLIHQMYFARRVQAASSTIVISQVYGGGGNSGATFKNDFIELFNKGAVAVNVSGWTVQYTSATGTTWTNITALTGTIQPGHYYLVQEAAGAGGSVSLPTPDASGGIAMSANAGRWHLLTPTPH